MERGLKGITSPNSVKGPQPGSLTWADLPPKGFGVLLGSFFSMCVLIQLQSYNLKWDRFLSKSVNQSINLLFFLSFFLSFLIGSFLRSRDKPEEGMGLSSQVMFPRWQSGKTAELNRLSPLCKGDVGVSFQLQSWLRHCGNVRLSLTRVRSPWLYSQESSPWTAETLLFWWRSFTISRAWWSQVFRNMAQIYCKIWADRCSCCCLLWRSDDNLFLFFPPLWESTNHKEEWISLLLASSHKALPGISSPSKTEC